MPIKTLHLTNYYHKNSGGISTSFNNLMAAAERHRRHVRLIVPGESEAVEDVNEFAKLYYIPARQSPIFDKRYRMILPWQYMPSGTLIRKIMIDEMPDLVEVTDKYTLSMMGAMVRRDKFSQLGRPLLVHFSCERMDDNVASFLSTGRMGKWLSRNVIGKYILPSFDFHIANSTYTGDEFMESVKGRKGFSFNKTWRLFRAPRIPLKERIRICPRGVDADQFSPERRSESVREKMLETVNGNSETKLLLYAGRISPEKKIGLLVETMKVLAANSDLDIRLLVAGDGPLADKLKTEGSKIGEDKITLLGHLDKETLSNYYANADVFVHPNPKEPFGIAPLEAMASGVPTVAPRSGGILSYATDDNAWLSETTPETFAESIIDAATNEPLRKERTEDAVRTALANTREHSTDRLFATYDEIYEDFQNRKELFTYAEAAKKFDYSTLIDD